MSRFTKTAARRGADNPVVDFGSALAQINRFAVTARTPHPFVFGMITGGYHATGSILAVSLVSSLSG